MGGKSSPPPPDFGPLAEAAKEAAQIQADLGYAQIAEARRQYDDTMPFLRGIAEEQLGLMNRSADLSEKFATHQMGSVDRQLALMEETAAQGRDYYNYMKNTFRPVEKKLVADAQKFNTREEFERQAAQAAADLARRGGIERATNARSMASMGVNPNSGRFQALGRRQALQQAALGAGATTKARQNAQAIGHARMMDAAGLGRGLPGASQGSYALASQNASGAASSAGASGTGYMNAAINAGNSAGQNFMAPGQGLMAGLGAGASTIAQGQQMQLGGLSTIANAQNQAYMEGMNQSSPIAQLAGTAIGIMASDRRLKENIVRVGVDERTGLSLYEFNYKDHPEMRFRGVLADEVLEYMPEAVATDPNGFMAVNYSKLGIEMVEVPNG